MNINSQRKQNGFIHIIVIFVMAVIILSLLGVDFNILFKNRILQENFKFVWDFTKLVWNKYLLKPANFIWATAKNYIWNE